MGSARPMTTGARLAGSLCLVGALGLHVSTVHAQAFRAPTMNEIYLTGIHFPIISPGRGPVGFNRFEANRDLKP